MVNGVTSTSLLIALPCLGAVSVLIWLGILLHPARPWDFQPVGATGGPPPGLQAWPPSSALWPPRTGGKLLRKPFLPFLNKDIPANLPEFLTATPHKTATPTMPAK